MADDYQNHLRRQEEIARKNLQATELAAKFAERAHEEAAAARREQKRSLDRQEALAESTERLAQKQLQFTQRAFALQNSEKDARPNLFAKWIVEDNPSEFNHAISILREKIRDASLIALYSRVNDAKTDFLKPIESIIKSEETRRKLSASFEEKEKRVRFFEGELRIIKKIRHLKKLGRALLYFGLSVSGLAGIIIVNEFTAETGIKSPSSLNGVAIALLIFFLVCSSLIFVYGRIKNAVKERVQLYKNGEQLLRMVLSENRQIDEVDSDLGKAKLSAEEARVSVENQLKLIENEKVKMLEDLWNRHIVAAEQAIWEYGIRESEAESKAALPENLEGLSKNWIELVDQFPRKYTEEVDLRSGLTEILLNEIQKPEGQIVDAFKNMQFETGQGWVITPTVQKG
jgi:hypothetical protein